MRTTLIITSYNRPEYLKRCYESIAACELPYNLNIILVDDASTDEETLRLFREFYFPNVPITKITTEQNEGIRKRLLQACDIAFGSSDIVINLDGDAIVKPHFINRLLELKEQHLDNIITGFNCKIGNRHPLISEHEGYSLKKYVGGINMCFDAQQYTNYIRPALLKAGNWDHNACIAADKDRKPIVVAVPSLVQHIGVKSSMGHDNNPDIADDFKLLSLPDVTLFGIDAHDPKGILRSAEICQRDIEFGDVKIITERLFVGREGYSDFCINRMAEYVNTSHVLIIHADGYILNPSAWDNDWLQYDYIGATWWYKDNMNVGNGGFSLRSKKLLDMLSVMGIEHTHPEDNVICRELRPILEQQGIKFAPEEVANRFSIEAYNTPDNKYNGQFGFHGYNVDLSEVAPYLQLKKVTAPINSRNRPVHNLRKAR